MEMGGVVGWSQPAAKHSLAGHLLPMAPSSGVKDRIGRAKVRKNTWTEIKTV